LVAATISTALAVDRHHALEWYRWVVLEPLAFFALLLAAGTRRSWPWLFAALVAAGLASGIIGLWQYITHTDLTAVPGTSVRRIHALYGSPDNLGLLYDRVLPIWFAVAISPIVLWRRALWCLIGAVMVAALFLTYSRGAWLGVGIGCLVVLTLRFRWGRWLLLGALLVGVVGLGVKGSRLVDLFRSAQTPTAQVRVGVWKSSLQMIRDHPVFGVGPDNFVHYYAPTRKEDLYQRECAPGLGYMQPGAGNEPCLSHPHDEFLDFWLSTGLLGLASFIWLEVVFWRQALAAWQSPATATGGLSGSAVLVGCMGAMAGGLVHGLVDNSYFLIDLAIIFWLLCAYVSSLRTAEAVDAYG
jgi:putative inorganic carbon (HCO3(-)) transporter